MDYGWLNLGSLLLGLIAWLLPVVNMMRNKKQSQKKWMLLSFVSMIACATSICFQIFYNYHLVMIEDWSALMDTIGAVALASSVLLIVTIMLNALTIISFRERSVR
ncbi:hypothetical protein [Metabacillus malikii]|uniref:Cytochrome c oxidase subunit 4 n=1 Tax=Metabacillus malikii TaxID=1504265 RepID=A0ABT9ZDR8_9BACI|nr:hypothetical protein [Metabacillus malikii]MDQ0230160.1 cytochrome c oxidase subunit 4 [Metabacillus malikii]